MEKTKTSVERPSPATSLGPAVDKLRPAPELTTVSRASGDTSTATLSENRAFSSQVSRLMRQPSKFSMGSSGAKLSSSIQRQVGNNRLIGLMQGPQAKLSVSTPQDREEKEADEVAAGVVSGQKMARISRLRPGVAVAPIHCQPSEEEEEEVLQAVRISRQEKEEDEEEDVIQTKAEEGSTESQVGAASTMEAQIKSPGAGRPLPDTMRSEMEAGLGVGLSDVRVHDTAQDGAAAEGLNAKAFAYRNHIWLSPGASIGDRKLMAHELTHVVQQTGAARGGVHRMPAISSLSADRLSRQGLLTAAQEVAAIGYNTRRYDERSIRIIQIVAGAGVDGVFAGLSAEAVAAFQSAQGIGIDGQVGPTTLDAMVLNRAAAARHEHAIQLVVDYYNIDISSDTLAVHFNAAQAAAGQTNFETGNLRVITLGPPAFVSEAVMKATIDAQLAVPAPAVAVPGPRPALLNAADELAAISYNRGRFRDARSINAIQGFVGTGLDGTWGADTVQRIAQEQTNAGLGVDGKVGELTLEHIVMQLIATGNQNAAIRLIVSFYNLRDDGNLLAVYYDPAVGANASTDYRPNEPVRVRVGPSGLAQPFAGIVHTIAHEYEHVRRLKQGIVPAATHEFLGEAIEILSVGMPEEALETLAPGAVGYVPGFADDAGRALNNWNAMALADRRRFRGRFIAVRNAVRNRIAAGTPAQQALHAGLVAGYNAVVVPPP